MGGGEAGTALRPPRGAAPTFGRRARGGPRRPARGQSRRAAAAPAHRSGRGPGARPKPGSEPRRRARAQGWHTPHDGQGRTTAAGRQPPAPTRDEGPRPGPRPRPGPHPPTRGKGERPGKGGGRPAPHIARTPVREGPPGRARAHARAERGNATRGGRALPDADARDGRLQGGPRQAREARRTRGTRRPGSEERAGRRRGTTGEAEATGKARERRPAGKGTPRDPSGAADRGRDTHAGVSPPAASEREGGPARHPERPTGPRRSPRLPPTTAAVAAGPPAPSLPSHARHRPTPRHPPGSPPGPTRGATDPVPKARAGGRGHRANQWPAAAPPTRRCRVRSQTGPPTDVKPVSRSGRREDRRAAGGEEGTDGQGHPGARRGGGSGRNLRHGRATRKTRPRDPTATDTRAVPRRPAWDAGRPSAPTETRLASPGVPPPGAPKRPQPQARQRQHHHRARDSLVHPPARSRSGRPARPHRGTLSQGQAARPRATQTRSWAPVTTRHTGAGGEPTRGGGGHAPDGTPRAHTHRPPAATSQPAGTPGPGPARRDPPPTQKGEARATVGDEPRSATTAVASGNPRSPPRTPSRGKGRRALCERVATAALPSRRQRQRRQSGGSGTPRHASRIAREGFLTEGGSHSPTRQPPLLGPAEAPRDAWGREGACSTRKHLRAATLSVRGQGGGPAGARVRATPRGPPVHPPPSFRGKAPPKSTHTQPVGGRTAAPRRPAGARATGPNPPRSLTRPARTRQRGARDVRSPDQADALPRVGGARLVSLDRLEPHTDELPQDPRADTAAATGGGGAGGGNDTPPLGLGHLRDNPERSRSTAKAQAEPTLAHTPREGSTTGRRDGIPHRRGRGAARKSTTTGGDSEGCLPRQRTPPTRPATQKAAGGTARSGRAPHPTRLPHTRHPQAGRGETRGPRGAEREERSRSPRTSAPRPSRLGPGPGEHDVTTSITKSPPGAEVGRPAGRRPAPGKGRRTTQRRRERLTRTARSQRGGVVAAAPGARSGERTGAGWPSPPSPPPPGGSETRTRAGTGSRDTPGRARGQQARGPQQAAQAGARPASRVTGRPEPRTHPESQPLQRQVARGQRVSNNPVAQDADSE